MMMVMMMRMKKKKKKKKKTMIKWKKMLARETRFWTGRNSS